MLKIFQIGPLWADWQTPEYVPNSHLYSKYLQLDLYCANRILCSIKKVKEVSLYLATKAWHFFKAVQYYCWAC